MRKVTLVYRPGLSQAEQRYDVTWPEGWSLPRQGESVKSPEIAGQVSGVEYDLRDGSIVVYLR